MSKIPCLIFDDTRIKPNTVAKKKNQTNKQTKNKQAKTKNFHMLFRLTQRWKWLRIKFRFSEYNHIFKFYNESHLSTEPRIIWWSLFIIFSYYNNEHIIYWLHYICLYLVLVAEYCIYRQSIKYIYVPNKM